MPFSRPNSPPAAVIVGLLLTAVLVATAMAGNTARRGAPASVPNACKNSATANNSQITVDTSADAPATAGAGAAITLTNLRQQGAIPGSIFVAGYNLGLLTTGTNNVPTAVYTYIRGTSVVAPESQKSSTENTTITTNITDPDGTPGTGDETATDATFDVTYDDMTFTAGDSGTATFRQDSISPPSAGTKTGSFVAVASLAGGFIKVTFACTPGTVAGSNPGTPTYVDPAASFASTTLPEATPSPSPDPSATPSPSPSPSPSASPSPSPSPSPSASPSASPSPEPTASPTPTSTPDYSLPTPSPTSTSSPTPSPSPSPTPGGTPKRCKVPDVKGKKVGKAKKALRKANCKPGKVIRKKSATVKKNRVIKTKPKAGANRPKGTRVKLVVAH